MSGKGGVIVSLLIFLSLFSLQAGFIRHTVNKITFSEQCYYVFGDLCGSMSYIFILLPNKLMHIVMRNPWVKLPSVFLVDSKMFF